MYYVYILLCAGGSLYTGISPDPEARFREHVKGTGSKYTRSHKPLKILYTEGCGSRSTALKRELEIKSWDRNRKLREFKLEIPLLSVKPAQTE